MLLERRLNKAQIFFGDRLCCAFVTVELITNYINLGYVKFIYGYDNSGCTKK